MYNLGHHMLDNFKGYEASKAIKMNKKWKKKQKKTQFKYFQLKK